MLFDSDVMIWVLRGNVKAAQAIDTTTRRCVSVVNCLELLQGARNKREQRIIQKFLSDAHVDVLPLTPGIGQRALVYMEEYGLAMSLSLADALIAATAVEANEPLLTGNDKHFRAIKELELVRFRS